MGANSLIPVSEIDMGYNKLLYRRCAGMGDDDDDGDHGIVSIKWVVCREYYTTTIKNF